MKEVHYELNNSKFLLSQVECIDYHKSSYSDDPGLIDFDIYFKSGNMCQDIMTEEVKLRELQNAWLKYLEGN